MADACTRTPRPCISRQVRVIQEDTPGDSHRVKGGTLGDSHQVKGGTLGDSHQVKEGTPGVFRQAKEGTPGGSRRAGEDTPGDFHQVKENTVDIRQAKENTQQDIHTHTPKATHTLADICAQDIRSRGEGYLRQHCKSLLERAEEERLHDTDANLPPTVPQAMHFPATVRRLTPVNPPTAIPAFLPTPSLAPPAIAATRRPPLATVLVFVIPPIAVPTVTVKSQKKVFSVRCMHTATPLAVGMYSAAAGADHGTKRVIAQGLCGGNSMAITIRAAVALRVAAAAAAAVLARAIRAQTLARTRSRNRVAFLVDCSWVSFFDI